MDTMEIIAGPQAAAVAVLLAGVAGFCLVAGLVWPLLVRRSDGRARHAQMGARHRLSASGTLGAGAKLALRRLRLPVFAGGVGARRRLAMAGFRGTQAFSIFLVCRMLAAGGAVMTLCALAVMGTGGDIETGVVASAVGLAGALALLPDLALAHLIERRRTLLSQALPDALDLLLICMQSGLPIELALQRVGLEMRASAPAMADELELTLAELGHLPCRHAAYERMAERTGVPAMRALALNLAQAERYGAPIARTLDVAARENREQRLARAERLAASLGAKMAVVVVLFFLPALILILIGPVLIGPGLSGTVFATFN